MRGEPQHPYFADEETKIQRLSCCPKWRCGWARAQVNFKSGLLFFTPDTHYLPILKA